MRLSESLRRNIIKATTGGVVNNFLVKRRRSTLFFEDILAVYVKECEEKGYGKEMLSVSQKWLNLTTKELMPNIFKKLPPNVFFNTVARNIWTNIGIMDDMRFEMKGERVEVRTLNEYITRLIGKNSVNMGTIIGSFNVIFGREIDCEAEIDGNMATYRCLIRREKWGGVESKGKEVYNALNRLPGAKGPALADAIRKRIFILKKNRLYFRGKCLVPVENTFFHLVSDRGIMLDRVPAISRDFFGKIMDDKSPDGMKLGMLKNILQITGWGMVNFRVKNKKSIALTIKNPPYGLQVEPDRWDFMVQVVLGYMQLLNGSFSVKKTETSNRLLKVDYIA